MDLWTVVHVKPDQFTVPQTTICAIAQFASHPQTTMDFAEVH